LLRVPGHSNTEGNEAADNLAKQAATTQYIGPEPALGLSTITTGSKIRQQALNEHNKLWNNAIIRLMN